MPRPRSLNVVATEIQTMRNLWQASGITTLHNAGTIAQANRQGRSGCMGSGMRSMETCSQSGAHPKGKKKEKFSSAVVTAPHQGVYQVSRQLIFLDAARIASWILGTSVPLKKGPSARGLQTVPHSKTGTRALLGPCAPAFRRCALRRRRRSRRRCCYTLSAACTRSALVRS